MELTRPRRILVAGCSYGGMAFVVNLLDLCSGRPARGDYEKTPPIPEALKGVPVDVQIVDERDGYYHLIGSPLAFASETAAKKFWQKYSDIPSLQHPSVRISQASVQNVDPERMVATIKDVKTGETSEHSYDYVIAATGLRRPWPTVPQSLTQEKYIQETSDHVKLVQNADQGVVIIGGGAVGIEMAAELKVVYPSLSVTLVQSRNELLSAEPLPEDFKSTSLKLLRETGVNVILGHGRVTSTIPIPSDSGRPLYNLTLADGTTLKASHVINAVSHPEPTASYLPPSTLDPSTNLIKISPLLRFLPDSHPKTAHHLALGDIAKWSGIKRCGGALAMGYHASQAIFEQILYEQYGTPKKLAEWPEVPPMIALVVGKKAVVYDPTEGTRSGEEEMELFFGEDLGWKGCWDHLKLSQGWEEEKHDSPVVGTQAETDNCAIPKIKLAPAAKDVAEKEVVTGREVLEEVLVAQ
ncbi:hypothetical protein CBER1_08695 [Cercospora berteroae]|uniref:FAD/NAD(P)-binding domain-containing protein n=1 Tax=Cercospora berteroae TaxID=357750 RepID=A0A2S6C6L9_9PEZI|nr:hypothetical protein CBER1_08695 [Cercospora berteroae]